MKWTRRVFSCICSPESDGRKTAWNLVASLSKIVVWNEFALQAMLNPRKYSTVQRFDLGSSRNKKLRFRNHGCPVVNL